MQFCFLYPDIPLQDKPASQSTTHVHVTVPLEAHLATDGSNDIEDFKLYSLVVKYFDDALGRVCTTLLAMSEAKESTALKIFEALHHELSRRGLTWTSCLSFGADNANVMQGTKLGLAYHLQQANDNLYNCGMCMPFDTLT